MRVIFASLFDFAVREEGKRWLKRIAKRIEEGLQKGLQNEKLKGDRKYNNLRN